MVLIKDLITRFPNLNLTTAVNAAIGIDLVRSSLPDVILMDLNLPGISGTQALQILREDPATADIPVIALSANAMPRDIEKGLKAGFSSYLTKPIKIADFTFALKKAIRSIEQRTKKEETHHDQLVGHL